MTRILVVGAGPAGLAATEALLSEGGGELDVELCSLEPWLGGNAAAFPTADGRVVEQGLHCWFGFYEGMRDLLARAGVDIMQVSSSGQGEALVWEERDRRTHRLYVGPHTARVAAGGLAYTGMTWSEKLRLALFFARAAPEILAGRCDRWDDECLTAWCLRRGFPASLASTRLWRVTREAQFNHPGEISAYGVLQVLRAMGRDFSTADWRFPMGAMCDLWWNPIGQRIRDLGGRISLGRELFELEHDGRRVTGLRFREVASAGPEDFLQTPLPVVSGSERWRRDFDQVVLAIPVGSFQRLAERTPSLGELRGLRGISRITTAVPLGLHVWHRARVRSGPRSFVLGLDLPLGAAVDVKPFHPSYRDDPRFGAVLHFVGPEGGYEEWSDRALMERSMASIQRVDGYGDFDLDGVRAWKLVRHVGHHRRYWCSEPGSLRHKPPPGGALDNLWLAGDWVRSELDFPCMETAIRAGRAAAVGMLERIEDGTQGRRVSA